jgi:hypothetical protein
MSMKLALNVLGVLLSLTGVVWFFQGINVIQGSFMTADPTWAIIGGICVVVGVAMLVFANRKASAAPPGA